MNFAQIILEPEQKELFIRMVEVAKSVPRDKRSPFLLANSSSGTCLIAPSRTGSSENITGFAKGDPDMLSDKELLRLDSGSRGGKNYVITPEGFQYYEWLIKQQGAPVERIEQRIRKYLDMDGFRKRYAKAYEHLIRAEEKLWESDSQKHFTVIGHECREAMQEFAADLYTQVFAADLDEDKKKNIKRIQAVIDQKGADKGSTVKPFLDALLDYWGTLSDLVQRQEHGAQKEGETLTWEDARRLVFQTVNVMSEIDRTLGVKS